jgi:hypothetical protein
VLNRHVGQELRGGGMRKRGERCRCEGREM